MQALVTLTKPIEAYFLGVRVFFSPSFGLVEASFGV